MSLFYLDEDEPIRFRGFRPKGQAETSENRTYEFTVTRHALATDRRIQSIVKESNLTRGMYFLINAGISHAKHLEIGVFARKGKDHDGKEWTQFMKDSDITCYMAFLKGICHDGESDRSQFFNVAYGRLGCLKGCDKEPSNISLKDFV